MTDSKKIFFAVLGAVAVYCAGTYIRFAGGMKWPGYDGSEYHYAGKNIAAGRGLEVSAVTQFYPRPPSVVHRMAPFHMPLNYYLLGGSYAVFGDNSVGARAPGFILDLILTVAVFFWAFKLSGDPLAAFFASAIYAVHPAAMDARSTGGAATGFATFFTAFFIWYAYRSFDAPRNFIRAGLLGALSYLIRNEGLFTVVALSTVYAVSLRAAHTSSTPAPPRKSVFSDDKFRYFVSGVAIIAAVFVLWEIRNYSVFGAQAASSRQNMMFGRDYYDMWRYNPEPGLGNFIKEYLKVGSARIVVTKVQSFQYKIARGMLYVGFPLALFILPGIKALRDKKLLYPVGAYFVSTYVFFGFFNAHSQDWGWYGAEVLLPFWIILAVAGCFGAGFFSDDRKKRLFGVVSASAILLFYSADAVRSNIKSKRDISRDAVAVLAAAVGDFSERRGNPVIMLHSPFVFNYFRPELKTVQIPTNEPLDGVLDVINRYGCEYLVLYGEIPSRYPFVFSGLYAGSKKMKGFREVLSVSAPAGLALEGAGRVLKIFKIEKSQFAPKGDKK